MRVAVFIVLLLALSGFARAEDITVKRVHFPAGASGTTVKGSIKGYAITDYVLGASAGQRMTVSLTTNNASSYFNVLPSGSETAIFNGSTSGNRFEDVLPANGDYRIRVYLMRNAARRDETATYTLAIAIHGSAAQNPATAKPDFADGLSGGPDYWEVHGVPSDDTLNIRSRASASSQILLSVPNGTVFQNLGCQMSGDQRWCKVTQPGGTGVTGWAAGRYLREAAAPSRAEPQTPRDAEATDSASNADKQACLAKVAEVTSNTVTVLSSEFSEANTVVIVGVGPDQAPWQCLVSRGRVAEVMSLVDEGAL